MPLTGEAKRTYQRDYMREQRKKGQQVVKAVRTALSIPGKGARPLQIPAEAILQGQTVLRAVLRETGLDLGKIVAKIVQQFTAQRPFGKDAIMSDDNDAQLRACELALRLHERAGTIPSASPAHNGAGSLHYHLHLDALVAHNPNTAPASAHAIEAAYSDSPSVGLTENGE